MKRAFIATLGLLICTASIVAYMWALYEVMRIGTCASGGPYVSARPCPEGTGTRIMALMFGIFGGLIGAGIYSAGRPKKGQAAAGLGVMLWFFLFAGGAAAMLLSAYGPAAPDDSSKTVAILLSVLFIPMGVIPLLGALGLRKGQKQLKKRAAATGGAGVDLASVIGASAPKEAPAPRPPKPAPARPPKPPPAPKAPGGPGDDPLDRLEQLDRLRKTGVITAEEFDRLKAEIMREM